MAGCLLVAFCKIPQSNKSTNAEMWISAFVLLLKFGGAAFDESQQFGGHFQARTSASGLKAGMTPRQNSSGGKEPLGRTSKRGDKYIRCLLVAGAVAILRHARTRTPRPASGSTVWCTSIVLHRLPQRG
jgi:hypothetical protein